MILPPKKRSEAPKCCLSDCESSGGKCGPVVTAYQGNALCQTHLDRLTNIERMAMQHRACDPSYALSSTETPQ